MFDIGECVEVVTEPSVSVVTERSRAEVRDDESRDGEKKRKEVVLSPAVQSVVTFDQEEPSPNLDLLCHESMDDEDERLVLRSTTPILGSLAIHVQMNYLMRYRHTDLVFVYMSGDKPTDTKEVAFASTDVMGTASCERYYLFRVNWVDTVRHIAKTKYANKIFVTAGIEVSPILAECFQLLYNLTDGIYHLLPPNTYSKACCLHDEFSLYVCPTYVAIAVLSKYLHFKTHGECSWQQMEYCGYLFV